jgi:dienelactone hydrolase
MVQNRMRGRLALSVGFLCAMNVHINCREAPTTANHHPQVLAPSDTLQVDPWAPVPQVVQTELFERARSRFVTKLIKQEKEKLAVPRPPANKLRVIKYTAPLGEMPAYISIPRNDAQKHPAIIWLVGGFANSIDRDVWAAAPESDDQSASAFWQAGVVTMYPSLRGGNQNPGVKESLYGEVDDVMAAYRYLAKLPFVDTNRIYLGGHSVDGTLALLVAEAQPGFRAVFSFGPVLRFADYGDEVRTFDDGNSQESLMRAPIEWLHSLRSPTYIAEGDIGGNGNDIESFANQNRNPLVSTALFVGHHHSSYLRRASRFLAKKLLADSGVGVFALDITDMIAAVKIDSAVK